MNQLIAPAVIPVAPEPTVIVSEHPLESTRTIAEDAPDAFPSSNEPVALSVRSRAVSRSPVESQSNDKVLSEADTI